MNSKVEKYLIEGELYDPILYGDEDDVWGDVEDDSTCPDCGCKVGEQHLPQCDVERCPKCGLQFIGCDCGVKYQMSNKMIEHLDFYKMLQEKDNIKLKKDIEMLMKKFEKENKKKKNKDQEM